MDPNFPIAILKFMDSLGITQRLTISRSGWNKKRVPFVCVKIELTRRGNTEYEQYHCYEYKSNEKVVYSEGNEVIGVGSGVMAYLGANDDVDRYFEILSRKVAKKHFESEK